MIPSQAPPHPCFVLLSLAHVVLPQSEYEAKLEDEKDKVRLLLELEMEESCTKIREECAIEKEEAVKEIMKKLGLV